MYEEQKELPVFSQRIAGHLMIRGFRLHGIKRNRKFNEKNVFYFKDCQEVRQAIEEIREILAQSGL